MTSARPQLQLAREEVTPSDDWPHTKRPMPWAVAGFLAMIWLIPFDSVTLPVSLPLGAKLDRPLLIGLAALWVLSLLGARTVSRLRLSPVHWAFLALLLIAIVSIVFNDATIVRLGELELAMRKLALLFSYALLFVIVASSIKPTEVRNLTTFMLCLAPITAIAALVEFRTGYNVFFDLMSKVLPVSLPSELGATDSIGRKSIIGPTIHPLAIAMMMSLALPFAVMAFLESSERRMKVRYALLIALMIAAAVATQRKTSFVAPAFGLLVLFAYRPKAVVKLVPVLLLLIVVVHAAAPGALGGVSEQLKPANLFGVATTKDRQSDYSALTPDVINHPFLGRGYESYDQKKYRILDNQYLSTIIGIGLLGVTAYLCLFGAMFMLAHRTARASDPRRAPPAIAAGAAIASLVVGSALLDWLALPQLAYMASFIGGLVVVAAEPEMAKRRARPSRATRQRFGTAQMQLADR